MGIDPEEIKSSEKFKELFSEKKRTKLQLELFSGLDNEEN